MRFEKGSRVEVLSKKKGPAGAWRVAVIVADNVGGDYDVKFERYRGISKATVDRVKKDEVRPCPPSVKSVTDWAVDDIVEVLDDGYWKVAVIEAIEGEGFHVRILGSFDEFNVRKTNIRVRQSWEDNKWIVLEKDFIPCEDLILKARKRALTRSGYQSPVAQNNIGVQKACLSDRAPKRAFRGYSDNPEAYFGNPQKKGKTEENGRLGSAFSECSSSFKEKVDTAVCILDSWSQNNCRASHIDRKANFVEQKPADILNRIIDRTDSGGIVSSVGSCSPIENGSTGFPSDADTLSDAESRYRTGHEERECGILSGETHVSRNHLSELHTYRDLLEALYASGPLSWELEAYLTDIRSSLHISSDEHLLEVEVLRHTWLALKPSMLIQ